jgi:hypothetical protein
MDIVGGDAVFEEPSGRGRSVSFLSDEAEDATVTPGAASDSVNIMPMIRGALA